MRHTKILLLLFSKTQKGQSFENNLLSKFQRSFLCYISSKDVSSHGVTQSNIFNNFPLQDILYSSAEGSHIKKSTMDTFLCCLRSYVAYIGKTLCLLCFLFFILFSLLGSVTMYGHCPPALNKLGLVRQVETG